MRAKTIDLYLLILLLFSLNVLPSSGQGNLNDYFQQEVNTIINVRLDDKKHELEGNIFIDYHNNSERTLDTIIIHLWANAYSNKNSAFAKQMIQHNDISFHFAPDSLLGGYSKLDFRVDGEKIKWEYDHKNKDIAYLLLKRGLRQGEMITISTPFIVKIPGAYSRFGHVGQSYQITQWFPKPAVYDHKGWHPMPYLNMGEFYSEFGTYDVTISLPDNYFVAASGKLLTTSELERIEERCVFTQNYFDTTTLIKNHTFPASSNNYKSLRYIAENVHDFAWFADKRYFIKEGKAILNSGKEVKTQIFFLHNLNKLWTNQLKYVERGLQFYSNHVGEYPYPKVAAVQGELRAGGGMEYPMVTVISGLPGEKGLDKVITHEVGHNWFYGILAFNERNFPWLDEGINSYYENRYKAKYHVDSENSDELPEFIKVLDRIEEPYHLLATKKALAQASSLHSEDYTLYNYFLSTYHNPAVSLKYLADYLGQYEFDRIMQGFYEKWKFKHPYPADFRSYLEKESGKDLSWFFDGFIGAIQAFNYGFKGIENSNEGYKLKIKNYSKHNVPFKISGINQDNIVYQNWFEGFSGTREVEVNQNGIEKFYIDYELSYPDKNRRNNDIKSNGLFKKFAGSELKFLGLINDPYYSKIGWLPSVGWNKADGFMLGAMIHNHSFPNNRLQYFLHPLYNFGPKQGSGQLTNFGGQAKLSYDWFLKNNVRQFRLSIANKSFQYEFPELTSIRYNRKAAGLYMLIDKKLTDRKKTAISYDLILTDDMYFHDNGTTDENKERKALINRLSISRKDNNSIFPLEWKSTLEFGNANELNNEDQYFKICTEISTSYLYAKGKRFHLRMYAAWLPWTTYGTSTRTRTGSLGLIGYAMNDYSYDDYFFDRGSQEGFWSKQLNMTGGGFKNAVNPAYNLGQSNKYVGSLNLKADLPFNLGVLSIIKPYFDMGVYAYLPTINEGYQNKFLYSGGLMIDTFEGICNIYLPLVNSESINSIYKEDDYFIQRMSFSVNLKFFDFTKLLERNDWIFGQ